MDLNAFKKSVDKVPKEIFSDEQKKRAKKVAEDLMNEFETDTIQYILDNLEKIREMNETEVDGLIIGKVQKWKASTWKNSLSSFKTFVEKHCPEIQDSLTKEVLQKLSIYCKSTKKKTVSKNDDAKTEISDISQELEDCDPMIFDNENEIRIKELENEVSKLKEQNKKILKQQEQILDIVGALLEDSGSKVSLLLFKNLRTASIL